VPADFYKKCIDNLKKNFPSIRVCLDADNQPLKYGIQAHPYIVKPNIWEFSRLISKKITSFEILKNAAEKFVSSGISFLIITLGEKGAIGFSKNESYYTKSVAIKKGNTVGCGDIFLGAFAMEISRSGDFRKSLLFATAAGTAKSIKPGTEIPEPEEIEKILNKVSIKSIGEMDEKTKISILPEMPEKKLKAN